MSYQHLKVERQDASAIVTIDRQAALNALSPELLVELGKVVSELEDDAEVAVVVLTGAGKAFVAGADISAMVDMGSLQAQNFAEVGHAIGNAIETSAKVYIAAVNGFALGGGCELALCCDFIYASGKAKFGQPEVKIGVIPGFGGTQRLGRRVGVAKAKELILTGEMIGADEALRIGLVDKLCPPEGLLDACTEIAKTIAANSSLAVANAKAVLHEGLSMTLEQGNRLEQLAFANLFSSHDQKEGMTAFLAKRAPKFRGE